MLPSSFNKKVDLVHKLSDLYKELEANKKGCKPIDLMEEITQAEEELGGYV